MFPFLTFLLFFMAVSFSSGRSRKGKASLESPSLLEHHLPKSAHPLVSPLSDDDREVLTYILAFGLLQMLGVYSCKLQCKPRKDSSVKVGLKRELVFPSHPVSAKSRQGSKKASSHKPSCTCDCFSCYSSFWSRWTASPNRDLLNKIIEIAEMPEEEELEEQKASKGKERKKKQEKKRALEKEAGGKNSKVGLPKGPTSSNPSVLSLDMAEIVEAMPATSARTSMDRMYDALWDNVSKDEALGRLAEPTMGDAGKKERLSTSAAMKDVLPHVDAWSMQNKNSMDACMSWESSSTDSSTHGRAPAMMDDEVDGRFATHDSPGGLRFASTQWRNNSKFHRAGKRRSKAWLRCIFCGTSGQK